MTAIEQAARFVFIVTGKDKPSQVPRRGGGHSPCLRNGPRRFSSLIRAIARSIPDAFTQSSPIVSVANPSAPMIPGTPPPNASSTVTTTTIRTVAKALAMLLTAIVRERSAGSMSA